MLTYDKLRQEQLMYYFCDLTPQYSNHEEKAPKKYTVIRNIHINIRNWRKHLSICTTSYKWKLNAYTLYFLIIWNLQK